MAALLNMATYQDNQLIKLLVDAHDYELEYPYNLSMAECLGDSLYFTLSQFDEPCDPRKSRDNLIMIKSGVKDKLFFLASSSLTDADEAIDKYYDCYQDHPEPPFPWNLEFTTTTVLSKNTKQPQNAKKQGKQCICDDLDDGEEEEEFWYGSRIRKLKIGRGRSSSRTFTRNK